MRRAKRLPLDELAAYLLSPPESPARVDWRAVFVNDHPVELEVGFGKGLFLLNACQACPEVNFLGIEILRKYQLYAATRFAKRGFKNVRLVKADAREFLRDCVADESFQAIHVHFPDPWWKKRHFKRRLFTPDFAVQCERTLQSGGRLYVVTDVADYFAVISELLEQHTRLKTPGAEATGLALDPKEPAHDLDYLTNFERKFRKEGRTICRRIYEKI
ncbi:MAG TPA: tRNA (guanosine(46)-N7)-methyltransferase TrmB [Gemmataceae bacterium]|nr:tRNA (guanosine(46)-N7)-methyltransferase TrmB [Gemmataceae bacterium]